MHPDGRLICISTGLHVSDKVLKSVPGAASGVTGKAMMEAIVTSSLSSNGQKSYKPVTNSKLLTFGDMVHKTKNSSEVGHRTSLSPELVFRMALSLSSCRDNVDMEAVLPLPVTAIPTSLYHEDGTI